MLKGILPQMWYENSLKYNYLGFIKGVVKPNDFEGHFKNALQLYRPHTILHILIMNSEPLLTILVEENRKSNQLLLSLHLFVDANIQNMILTMLKMICQKIFDTKMKKIHKRK